jgi:hypothetical protein
LPDKMVGRLVGIPSAGFLSPTQPSVDCQC